MENVNEKQHIEREKKQTALEYMVKDISSDVANIAKTTGKVAYHVAMAPFVGMLNEETKARFYDHSESAVSMATQASYIIAPVVYGAAAYVTTESPNVTFVSLMAGVFESLFRAGATSHSIKEARRSGHYFDKEHFGTSLGYVPSKIIEYVDDKWQDAKDKSKMEAVKGGIK